MKNPSLFIFLISQLFFWHIRKVYNVKFIFNHCIFNTVVREVMWVLIHLFIMYVYEKVSIIWFFEANKKSSPYFGVSVLRCVLYFLFLSLVHSFKLGVKRAKIIAYSCLVFTLCTKDLVLMMDCKFQRQKWGRGSCNLVGKLVISWVNLTLILTNQASITIIICKNILVY